MTTSPPSSVTEYRCVLVLDEDLPVGLLANTAAVLALTLGARRDLIGPDLCDAGGGTHLGLTTIPIPILKASREIVGSLRSAAIALEGVLVVDVTDAAQTTTNYTDYKDTLGARDPDMLVYLGVALYGNKRAVNRLTGSLPLLR